MKANAPKRKIFNDAVDMLTDSLVAVEDGGLKVLPIDTIHAFHNHPFRLYDGERLEDMVSSIREYGILNPVIVLQKDNGYEMLSGHNRANAARIAGLSEIPAIVKTDLSDEEAYIYVIETNLMQRSFTDMAISEKAAVLKEQYEKVLYQRKREEIISELQRLEGIKENGGHSDHHSKNRDSLGEEYGLSGSSVARLMRVNELIPEIKDLLDKGDMNLLVAVQLSYAAEDVQRAVVASGKKISKDIAKRLREADFTVDEAMRIIDGTTKRVAVKTKNVKLPSDLYNKYFKGKDGAKVEEIIEKALAAWFVAEGGVDV